MLAYDLLFRKVLLWIQFLAAIVGFLYFFKYKHSYWKWFCVYLVVIFLQEYFWFSRPTFLEIRKQQYYAFFGIPIQYIFFYWLYGLKSLKNLKLFVGCSIIYILTYIPVEVFYKKLNVVYALNLTVGTILLTVLVVLEFLKQIKTDDILNFKRNKMFYINIGVILFYIGTYPFFAFLDVFNQEGYFDIRNAYYVYFRISLYLMYSLFITSLIWGKLPLK